MKLFKGVSEARLRRELTISEQQCGGGSWSAVRVGTRWSSKDVLTLPVFVLSQNCVEFYPLFLVSMWTCGTFFSEVIAAAGGLVYMVARQMYFSGYITSPKKRSFMILKYQILKSTRWQRWLYSIWCLTYYSTLTEYFLVCRLPGFILNLVVLGILSLLGSIGVLRGILYKYFLI